MEGIDPTKPPPPKTKPLFSSTQTLCLHHLIVVFLLLSASALLLRPSHFRHNLFLGLRPQTPPEQQSHVTVHDIDDDEELLRRALGIPAAKEGRKVGFLFLTRGALPLAPLWEMFFDGYQGLYSVYVHANPSYVESFPRNSAFNGRGIPSKEVQWGSFTMVEAERRLLASALLDPANRHFVLLSESCIPLFNFSTIHAYLTGSTTTFVESYDKPGPTGRGRYRSAMAPLVTLALWRKGSQWFHVDRALATAVISDTTYYPLFSRYCDKGCYADEHYLPTLVGARFGSRNANRSVTWVDWSENLAHPARFQRQHVTPELLERLRSGYKCEYNGRETRVCYLFGRKFYESTLNRLMKFAPSVMHFGHFDRKKFSGRRNVVSSNRKGRE